MKNSFCLLLHSLIVLHKEHKRLQFIKTTAADFVMSVKTRTVQNDFGKKGKYINRKKKN